MAHILSCTDGSPYAASIYQHSAWAATRLGIGVKVLHVLDAHRERSQGGDLTGAIGFNAGAGLTEELVKFEEAQARIARIKGKAILDDARQQLTAAGVADIETLQRHGSLVETLTELEAAAELIVIGKRGDHAASAKGHLGGQFERVIRTSIRPVLATSRAFPPISKFLIAYDGGPSITKALDFLITSPLLKGMPCHLLRAGKIDDNATWYLEEAAQRLRQAGYDVTSTATAGSPEDSITAAVTAQRADLLVMGAYGHSPIRQLILGSTTTSMVRTCGVPVLMFRQEDPDWEPHR
jgi:nucleotide-binding universal stress UspA family protein